MRIESKKNTRDKTMSKKGEIKKKDGRANIELEENNTLRRVCEINRNLSRKANTKRRIRN